MQKPTPENPFQHHTKIDIKRVLFKANDLSRQNTFPVFQGLLSIVFFSLVFNLFAFEFAGVAFSLESLEQVMSEGNDLISLFQYILTVLVAPMWAGLFMMSLHTLRNAKPKANSIFAYFSFLPVLGLVAIILGLLKVIGLSLLVLPGFYVFMASTFVVPLIIDKRCRPFQAMALSVRMTNQNFTDMALIYLVFLALVIAGFFTFFLGFIWIVPYINNVKAVLYQDLFCRNAEEKVRTVENSGVFDA